MLYCSAVLRFFFTSRRRHTRWPRDWSSDVCSSDLLKNSSWWQYFKVSSGNEFIDVTEVSKEEANDTKVVQFEVDDLGESLNAKVHIIVTGIPGLEYDNKYDIRFNFDTSDIPLNEGKTRPDPKEDPKKEPGKGEDPVEDPTNPGNGSVKGSNQKSEKICEDGEYDLPFEVLHADKDQVSVADEYFEKPAKLIVKDGKFTVRSEEHTSELQSRGHL